MWGGIDSFTSLVVRSSFLLILLFATEIFVGCAAPHEIKDTRPPVLSNNNISASNNGDPGRLVSNGEEVIWQGTSKKFNLRWTTSDLVIIHPSGREERLFSGISGELKRARIHPPVSSGCSIFSTFRVRSIVGSILSFQDTYYIGCEDIVYVEKKEITAAVDIARSTDFFDPVEVRILTGKRSRAVDLRSFFSDDEIFKALMKTPEIRETLKYAERFRIPGNLAELLKGIDEVGVDGIDGSGHRITNETWSSFIFVDLTSENVIVEIELKSSSASPTNPILRLTLPIPRALEKDLHLANARDEGALSVYLDKLSENKTTEIIETLNK